MEVFKLAFETVIIGLFALPCLFVIIDSAKPDLFTAASVAALSKLIPKELRPQTIALTLFPVVYLLGLMITPVAFEFLNDKDMLAGVLPNEETLQAWTYQQMGLPSISGVEPVASMEAAKLSRDNDSGAAGESQDMQAQIHSEFLHEESTLLLRSPEDGGRISRLHERLTVLQGATFTTFALMVLSGFAWCGAAGVPATSGGQPSWLSKLRRCIGLVLALVFILVATNELLNDLRHPEVGDMPIAELVFLLLAGFGLYVAIWGTRSRLRYHGLTFFIAFGFTLLCYAGYASTGATYDQEVFNTYRALSPINSGSPSAVQSTAPGVPGSQQMDRAREAGNVAQVQKLTPENQY